MAQDQYYPSKSKVTSTLLFRAMFRRLFWQGKIMPAFWTIVSIISLTVNVILIVVLISIGQQLFVLKNTISEQLVTGLYDNFKLMNEAVIEQTIIVDDTIPVQFELPVQTSTRVTLTEPTRIDGAQVNISASVLSINAPANIVLPAGTSLPIDLDITVPVSETVPVHLEVPVNIPLSETGLSVPFEGLIEVIEPYNVMLTKAQDSWEETALCQGKLQFICGWFLTPELFQFP